MSAFWGYNSKEQLVDYIVNNTSGIFTHSLVGNHLWYARKVIVNGREEVAGGVVLISCQDGDYGYKDIGIESHPFYYSCPKRIADIVTLLGDGGESWKVNYTKYRELVNLTKRTKRILQSLAHSAKISFKDKKNVEREFVYHGWAKNRGAVLENASGRYIYPIDMIVEFGELNEI